MSDYVVADPLPSEPNLEDFPSASVQRKIVSPQPERASTDHQGLASSRIELSTVFKTSPRYALRKAWLSGALFLLVTVVYVLSEAGTLPDIGGYRDSMVHRAEQILIIVHAVFLLVEVSFWEWYRRRVRFFIQGGRFHVRRGVFRRLESSAPMVGVTEFFIAQSSSDAILGLYSLHVMTPLGPANGVPRFTRIDGLSRVSAEGLLEWLARYVHQQEEGE